VDSSATDVTEHYRLGLTESGCSLQPIMLTEPPEVQFNHPAEEAFAQWLDAHGIEWQYEPKFFSLAENEQGHTIRGFLPDFYLPELDVYVEITTANVGFNSRKRRKIRLAEERHGVRTILMCKTGMRGLTDRYGLCYGSPRDEDVAIQSV
jgi:hypothetical protein